MKKPRGERFLRLKQFDQQFDRIPGLIWYPYVGQNFLSHPTRVMVFAHNIPMHPDYFEAKTQEWKAKDAWAEPNTIGEYTYCPGGWTKTFRAFVKGAVGLQHNYDENSDEAITDKVDEFIKRISYINYIQGLVRSEQQLANGSDEQVVISKKINKEFLRILGITHCICWGKEVFNHLLETQGHKAIEQRNEALSGFSTAEFQTDWGSCIKLLKVFHPSMPGFRPYSAETQTIISDFLTNKSASKFLQTP